MIPLISKQKTKVKAVSNPYKSYDNSLPLLNTNPLPEMLNPGLHVQKLVYGNNYVQGHNGVTYNIGKPYLDHSKNVKIAMRANMAGLANNVFNPAMGMINIVNEEKDINRSDNPSWYREELERQKRKVLGINRGSDALPNPFQMYYNGGTLPIIKYKYK